LLVLPGHFFLTVRAGQALAGSTLPLRKALATQAQALVPLGLGIWIAFTLAFALVKLPYVLTVMSDPLALGWNLLGTAHLTAFPDLSALSAVLEVMVLVGGLFWSTRVARQVADLDRTARVPQRQVWPMIGFCLLLSLGMVWLLVG
jgi:hypothetical protein